MGDLSIVVVDILTSLLISIPMAGSYVGMPYMGSLVSFLPNMRYLGGHMMKVTLGMNG
ncbi:hypothetical protein D3C84_1023240 [compost metagenome]